MIIRSASETDVQAIVDLSFALFQEDAGQRDPLTNLNWPREEGEEHYARLVGGENSVCLLAEVAGCVVGYLAGYLRPATSLRPVHLAELESMFVRQECRGRGVGTSLAQTFLAWSRERGAQRVSVTAYATNERALDFYRRQGFEPRNVTFELGL